MSHSNSEDSPAFRRGSRQHLLGTCRMGNDPKKFQIEKSRNVT